MRKLIMVVVALVCATVITGCGKSPHEKIVNDFCSVWQSRNANAISEFVKENFIRGELDGGRLDGSLEGRAKEYLERMAESQESIKTKVYRNVSNDKMNVSDITVGVKGKGLLVFRVSGRKIRSIGTEISL